MGIEVTYTSVAIEFREFLESENIGPAYLFEFIGESLENPAMQQVGYAMVRHAEDVLNATPECGMLDLVAECYRRTFLDMGAAARYGTESFVPVTPELAQAMVAHVKLRARLDREATVVHAQAPGMQ